MAGLLQDAGFTLHSRTLREPGGTESAPQAFLIARR
jgi:hypothetical protein